MNRTYKALARVGAVVVGATAVLATPAALGAASAATPSTITAAPDPALGTITTTADAAAHNSYSDDATFTVTYTAGDTNVLGDDQTLALSISGSSTAYFPTHAGGTGDYVSAGGSTATCAITGGATQTCTVAVGDDVADQVQINIQDTGDDTATPAGTETVNFNGIHYSGCAQAGINDDGTGGTDNCVTQGAINTPLTVTATYAEGGAPAANKAVFFDLSNAGDAVFSAVQPTGSAYYDDTEVRCTTNASGQCQITVQDASADTNVEIEGYPENTGNAKYNDAYAYIHINFSTNAVTPTRLDLVSSKVIAPSTQPNTDAAEPGDAIQNTYQVFGACTNTAGNDSCTGTALANESLTLSVDHGFFTPNCAFPTAPTGTPPTFTTDNYANCTFDPAAAVNGTVGALKNAGTTDAVTTNADGYVVVTLGIAKDSDFDDDGFVVASVTAGSLSPQVPGNTNAPADTTCGGGEIATPNIAGGAEDISTFFDAGCGIDSAWTTDESPLNGGTAKDVVVPAITNAKNTYIDTENNYNATDTGTINVPDVNRVVFVVHLTDQFGNLTTGGGTNGVTLTKTGQGSLYQCTVGDYNSTDACFSTGTTGVHIPQTDGTITQVFSNVQGSYTNLQAPGQTRYQADASDIGSSNDGYSDGNPGVNDGTQTDTLSWNPPTTTFKTYTAGSSTTAAFATYAAGVGAASTDTLTLNLYNQLAQPVVTFAVKPGNKVKTSTAVTVTSTIKDQFSNPIVDQGVQFVRSGANEASCTPIQNEDNDFEYTNTAGIAGYTFSCDQAGTSTVSIVVTGPGGTQLASGKEAIKFTGASTHVAKEKPALKLKAKGHHLKLTVKTHPKVHGKTVHFYRLVHGLKHLIGAAKTGKSGAAHLSLHVKKGTYRVEAKVIGLNSGKYDSRYSKTHKVHVK